MAEIIYARFDASGFNKLVEAAGVYSRRTPAIASNVAGYYVARQARYETHKMSVPLSRIDSELSAEVTPRISGRTGKAVGRNTKNPNIVRAMTGGRSKVEGIPFTWLIIGARAKMGSNYNDRTGNRWALKAHPFKDQPRRLFAKIMENAVRRMVNRRHSGGGFIQSGWIACIIAGEAIIPSKYRRGGNGGPPPLENKRAVRTLGGFTPAVAGNFVASCEIANHIGMAGGFGKLDQRRNEALWKAGEPALNYAIAVQAERTFNYIAEEEAKLSGLVGKH